MLNIIILAGGFGTRLQSIVKDVPKPMALVNTKPFLEYLLIHAGQFDINRIILSVGYKEEMIRHYFGQKFNQIPIIYSVENKPLGTGGAIKQALQYTTSKKTLIINGDTFFKIDLNSFAKKASKSADITIALKKMYNTQRYGTVLMDNSNTIYEFKEKHSINEAHINAGVYMIDSSLFRNFKKDIFSFEEFLENNLSLLNIQGIPFDDDYFIDIGIPKDYYKAQSDFKDLF